MNFKFDVMNFQFAALLLVFILSLFLQALYQYVASRLYHTDFTLVS